MHYHIDMMTHGVAFGKPVSSTGGDTLVESHISETNGLCRARTWMAHLADRDANYYAISPPPLWMGV